MFIFGTAIEVGVVRHQTGNESLPVSRHGSTHGRTLVGEVGPKFKVL